MAVGARRDLRTVNTWPGFVDALAALLMVVIFLLMVFVLAQFFLSEALSGRDTALDKLRSRVNELADLLSLEKRNSDDLRTSLSRLSNDLQASLGKRDALNADVRLLSDRAADAESLAGALANDVQALEALKRDLSREVQALSARADTAEERSEELSGKLAAAEDSLRVDRETIQMQTRRLAQLLNSVKALEALKKELETDISALGERAEDAEGRLLHESELSESARAEVARLNSQLEELKTQLARLNEVLDASQSEIKKKDIQIANLGAQVNAALANKVEELARYRSDFFGRLREILGPDSRIRIVGDRFVIQSEVLFASGSAELDTRGREEIINLAGILRDLISEFPPDLNWVLQVNGHTDSVPIATPLYASNMELSLTRALSVAELLAEAGFPADHIAAAGFGEFQPVDLGTTPEALQRNRRIELKLTQP